MGIYAMAKDNLLFKLFARVNATTGSPNVALWAQCLWALVLTLSGSYIQLLAYIVFTSLVFYIVTMLGLMKLGKANPVALNMKSRWDYVIPSVYIVAVSYLSYFLLTGEEKWFTSVMGLLFTLSGLPVYFVWKYWQRRRGRA